VKTIFSWFNRLEFLVVVSAQGNTVEHQVHVFQGKKALCSFTGVASPEDLIKKLANNPAFLVKEAERLCYKE
jgi:hypothetical protein